MITQQLKQNLETYIQHTSQLLLYSIRYIYVDIEIWSKLAKHSLIKRIASKWVHDFDCDCQHVNAFSIALLWHMFYFHKLISYSDAKVPVLMEGKHASVIYVYKSIFLLHYTGCPRMIGTVFEKNIKKYKTKSKPDFNIWNIRGDMSTNFSID